MTDEEYAELKNRLSKDGLILKMKECKEAIKGDLKRKELYFLKRAYEHFRTRQASLYELSMSRAWDDWTSHDLCLISYGWDNIRKLVLWTYGTTLIRQLPDDKQDEINDFAINIIDTIFDQYSKLWET